MKTCFVIAPIGNEDTETRERSDLILDYIIRPACAICGYEPLRADRISEPGLITSQVIQHVMDDPLVIADLTERNPNVFYELAIRHALRKPLVQIIRKGDPIPFDVAATRTIPIDHQNLRSVEEAKAEIERQIRATEEKPQSIESPISTAIDMQILRQSDKPEQQRLAELVAAVSGLRNDFLEFFLLAPDRTFFSDLADRAQEREKEDRIRQAEMLLMAEAHFERNSDNLLKIFTRMQNAMLVLMQELRASLEFRESSKE